MPQGQMDRPQIGQEKQGEPDTELELEPNSDARSTTDEQTPHTIGRLRKRPKYLEDYECLVENNESTIDYCCRATVGLPQTFKEALASAMSEKWKKAMKDEMTSFKENDTFSLVPLPEGRRTVGGKWVYAVKGDDKGNETYKARYVAKGYSQVEGLDYSETFSPTANLTSLRVLMQLAAHYGLILNQMDVKAAYLHLRNIHGTT